LPHRAFIGDADLCIAPQPWTKLFSTELLANFQDLHELEGKNAVKRGG
jgi:hypothetical protein